MQTRSWEQDGVKRYTTEIIASEMQMLDSKQDNQQSEAQRQAALQQQAAQQPQQRQRGEAPAQQATKQAGFDSFSDDIPFGPVEF